MDHFCVGGHCCIYKTNIIDCFQNVAITQLFDANFIHRNIYYDIINYCAVTTIFTVSLYRLLSVNLLFNK